MRRREERHFCLAQTVVTSVERTETVPICQKKSISAEGNVWRNIGTQMGLPRKVANCRKFSLLAHFAPREPC